jgi:hypothetical protein
VARSAVAGRPPPDPGLTAAANGRREPAEERRRRTTTPRPEPGAAAAAEVVGVGAAMVAGGCFSDARRGHVNEVGEWLQEYGGGATPACSFGGGR